MISAKVIADSLSPTGDRLTTLEVVFPRYILAELNTHRLFSKNSASSRAIPFKKMLKEVENNPFIPYAFQKDHSGMQGTEYLTDEEDIKEAEEVWLKARDLAVSSARLLNQGLGISKQLANRLLEPFMYHKILISATEWENFFNLRCPQYSIYTDPLTEVKGKSWKEILKAEYTGDFKDCDILYKLQCNKGQADIHMMFLAEAIYDAIQESTPNTLQEGKWHIPYGDTITFDSIHKIGHLYKGLVGNPDKLTEEQQLHYFNWYLEVKRKISIARCARLSYQTLGDNPAIDYEKDLELYEILSKSGHWSPFEHVARVMTEKEYVSNRKTTTSEKSRVTNIKGEWEYTDLGWCRNFRGFIQQRALID